MRNRARIEPPTRRPNGPPQAAGGELRRGTAPATLDQTFDGDGLIALRSAVATVARQLGAGDRRVEDLVLVAHELSSNVIRHGGGHGRLRMWRADSGIVCQVSDDGPGLADAETRGAALPPAQIPGGRGLWIARRLAVLRIETGPAGTTITAAVRTD
jgi:anti-sigma regulatory factor (Ser/Thr protein kinase)